MNKAQPTWWDCLRVQILRFWISRFVRLSATLSLSPAILEYLLIVDGAPRPFQPTVLLTIGRGSEDCTNTIPFVGTYASLFHESTLDFMFALK